MQYLMEIYGLYLIYYIISILTPKRIVAAGRLCEEEKPFIYSMMAIGNIKQGKPTSTGDGDKKYTPFITTLNTNTHIVCYVCKHTIRYLM